MNPKHSNPTRPRRDRSGNETWARAPYNFVPLPEKVVTVEQLPPQHRYEGLTGYLDCRLTTETPLYTRCAWEPDDFVKYGDKSFDDLPPEQKVKRGRFYSVSDTLEPVIPGSSLRGMIRTLVEIAGFGKMQWVTPERFVYRAVGDPSSLGTHYRDQFLGPNKATPPNNRFDYPSHNVQGGYLRKTETGWAVQPAVQHLGESFVHVGYEVASRIGVTSGKHAAVPVYVQPAGRTQHDGGIRGGGKLVLDLALTEELRPSAGDGVPPTGFVPATLVVSGHMTSRDHPKHWHCAIYEPKPCPQSNWIPISEGMWRVYRDDCALPRGDRATRALDEGDALFYLLDSGGNLVFFGPTMMFRIPYQHRVDELVPAGVGEGSATDLAEAVFGFVGHTNMPEAAAGRACFSDGRLEPTDQKDLWLWSEPRTPKVLGSPKPTSFQHYLTQQNPDDRLRLDHYDNTPQQATTIRGHKLYWHKNGQPHDDDILELDEERLKTSPKQYTRMQPVRANLTFRFSVAFENLREFELGALLWALQLPGEPGKQYRHKLGMAKSLGLGSVRIQPTLHLTLRTDTKTGRYARLFAEGKVAWHLADDTAEDVTTYLQAFDQYVRDRMDPAERGKAMSLSQVKRIRMLLKMLEWPGPRPELTGSMDVSQFRSRPVLPDPLSVGIETVAPEPRAGPSVRPKPERELPGGRQTGVVKWFNPNKGYGFITPDAGGRDVFVHIRSIQGPAPESVREGQRLSFVVVNAPKGPEAQQVRVE